MRLIATFEDNEFPNNGYNHTRNIVRGIVYNDNFEIALIKLHTTDIFGERDLYETPGGGVEKGETLVNAFKREILEEVGVTIDNIEEIGRVVDYYNLIYRKNNNHFFLAHISSYQNQHWTKYESTLFEGVVYMSIDEAIVAYQNSRDLPVNNIVRQRELPILKIAQKRLEKLKKKRLLEFRYFRNNLLNEIKRDGYVNFINKIINDKIIDFYYNSNKERALYILALIDYLCSHNNLPRMCPQYDEMRNEKLKKPLFVGSNLMTFNSISDAEKELGIKVIPEFGKYNIIEDSIYNIA